MNAPWTCHKNHLRFGERPLPPDLQRDELERPARRELLLPSHGSPGPEILIWGVGAGGVPVVLSRARRHFSTGIRLSPWSDNAVSRCLTVRHTLTVLMLTNRATKCVILPSHLIYLKTNIP